MFKKYHHIERLGTTEVEGILDGKCYVFPKIDGTNGSVWWSGGLQAGSRNRHLTLDNDNAGFLQSVSACEKTLDLLNDNRDVRLYGEWLVPHSVRTYRDDAWRRFYIFDVVDGDRLMPYEEYQQLLESYGLDYIPPMFCIENPTQERMYGALEQNNYLIKDGEGAGEGVVIKNYDYLNKYGRRVWAKLVTSEFKAKHTKAMGVRELKEKATIEDAIAADFVTKSIVDKVYDKISLENDGFSSRDIPRLLNTVFYDIVREEMWEIIKKFKNPLIDFKKLQKAVFAHVKIYKPELF